MLTFYILTKQSRILTTLRKTATENIEGKGENAGKQKRLIYRILSLYFCIIPCHCPLEECFKRGYNEDIDSHVLQAKTPGNDVNLLPHMSILDSPNSAANKEMMAKTWTNGDTSI